MAELTHGEYDALERAVRDGTRIAVQRRGTEFIVVPRHIRHTGGREAIEASHPTTGDGITLYIDEIDRFEIVK